MSVNHFPLSVNSSARPFWSVMLPVYNPPADYLRQAVESVLAQAPEMMQIEVVDDCSPAVDVDALVKSFGSPRIAVSRTSKNLGLAGCWNACVERANGQWVHILHQDDYVLPKFYEALAAAAGRHPEASLLAARAFYVDEKNVILSVSGRLEELERGGRSVEGLFYQNHLACPAVAIKRSFYESHGPFRSDLSYTLDYEMWTRAISENGGVVLADVLACHRLAKGSETGRLARTAENLRDMLRMGALFAKAHAGFNFARFKQHIAQWALVQEKSFREAGHLEAAEASRQIWRELTPLSKRCKIAVRGGWRRVITGR